MESVSIKVNIDETCKNCKESLDLFKDGVFDGTIKRGHNLVITPDYNTSGCMTHFHIGVVKDSMFKRPR